MVRVLREVWATAVDVVRCGDAMGHIKALAEVLWRDVRDDVLAPIDPHIIGGGED